MSPRYTPIPRVRQTRLMRSHLSPPSAEPQQSYEYGVNIHKRQRVSPSESISRDSEGDSVSSVESYVDQNDQAKRNIGLLLRAARVASGMTTLLFFYVYDASSSEPNIQLNMAKNISGCGPPKWPWPFATVPNMVQEQRIALQERRGAPEPIVRECSNHYICR